MKRLRNILPVLVILGGMLILFYPTISNFLIMRNASRAVNNYDASVEALSQEQYQKVLDAAHAYNEKLAQNDAGETDALASAVNSASTDEEYNSLLNIDGDGMMGYITVPKLEETLPIYHGTSEKVLQSGIGHLEQTSLPVGGASTHAALSGHRGLPTAKLFTDLNLMKKGDKFYITILKDTYAYQVDKITTVLPTDTKQLAIAVCKEHLKCHQALTLKPGTLWRLLQRLDVLRRPERVEAFIQACECDSRGRLGLENREYPQAQYVLDAMQVVRSIKAQDLPPDIQGPDIGEMLIEKRIKALSSLKQAFELQQTI